MSSVKPGPVPLASSARRRVPRHRAAGRRSSSAPGIAAQRCPRATSACSCWRTRTATALGLAVLILIFGPVSGAHFNPVVSAVDWLARPPQRAPGCRGATSPPTSPPRSSARSPARCWRTLMFDLPAVAGLTNDRASAGARGSARSSPPPGWSLLIFALARTGRAALVRGRGRRLHRRRVLVHQLHLVRQPGRHHRPGVHRHVRRHRPRLGAPVRRRPARRRRVGLALVRPAVPADPATADDRSRRPPCRSPLTPKED